MPSYSWICHACEKANAPGLVVCKYCVCPALASVVQVEFHKTGVTIDPLAELKALGRPSVKVLVPILSVCTVSIVSALIALEITETRCGPASEPGDSGAGGAAIGIFI